MKKTLVLTISIFLFCQYGNCQNYSPLIVGSKKWFKMPNASYTRQVLKNKVIKNEFEYVQSKTKYSWGEEAIVLLRIDSIGNEIYLDPISNTESVNFPTNPKLDQSWVSEDGAWKYEIYKIGESLKTPNNEYFDCLVIRAEQLTGRDKEKLNLYFNYYAPEIGYVGSKNSRGLMSWLVRFKK